jgi:tetratricopeptide (TPR) repeat protein
LQSGVNAEQHNDLDGAISAFRKATDAAPGAAIAFLRLGEAYIRKRDYATAIPPLKRAVELKPDSLPAHRLLGFGLLSEGYPAEPIPHFELTHESAAWESHNCRWAIPSRPSFQMTKD